MDSCKSPQASLWLYPLLVPSWLLMRILIFNALTLWHTTLIFKWLLMQAGSGPEITLVYTTLSYSSLTKWLPHYGHATSGKLRDSTSLHKTPMVISPSCCPRCLNFGLCDPRAGTVIDYIFFYTVRLYINPGAYSGHDEYYYNFWCIFTQSAHSGIAKPEREVGAISVLPEGAYKMYF
jgi:hypothetical protein